MYDESQWLAVGVVEPDEVADLVIDVGVLEVAAVDHAGEDLVDVIARRAPARWPARRR